MKRTLTVLAAAATLLAATPVFAQDTYQAGDATIAGEGTEAYGQLEQAADPNAYETNEGSAEWQSNTFDGTSSTGTYQDTDSLQPGGMTITPNSEE